MSTENEKLVTDFCRARESAWLERLVWMPRRAAAARDMALLGDRDEVAEMAQFHMLYV